MDNGHKERLMDILSIFSRTSALVAGFAILFTGGYFFEYQKQHIDRAFHRADVSASIIVSPVHVIAKTFSDELKEKNTEKIMRLVPKSEEADRFLDDLDSWNTIIQKETEVSGRGFFLSVMATTTGNTIHPYWGYFLVLNGKISEITWGENAYGVIHPTPSEDEYNTAKITNMGPYPWPTDDIWVNEATEEEVVIISEDQRSAIGIGEQATLVYRKTEAFQLKNEEKGFRVILTEE